MKIIFCYSLKWQVIVDRKACIRLYTDNKKTENTLVITKRFQWDKAGG